MGSMKSGVGDDPFADEDGSDTTENTESKPEAEPENTPPEDTGEATTPDSKQSTHSSTSTNTEAETETETPKEQINASSLNNVDVVGSVPHEDERIPFIMSRQSVKGSRDGKILQIALNQETQNYLEEAVREIQREYDDDVKKMDITEAVLLSGLMNLGDVDSVLQKWGYDFQG